MKNSKLRFGSPYDPKSQNSYKSRYTGEPAYRIDHNTPPRDNEILLDAVSDYGGLYYASKNAALDEFREYCRFAKIEYGSIRVVVVPGEYMDSYLMYNTPSAKWAVTINDEKDLFALQLRY